LLPVAQQCHNELRQWSVKMNVLIGVAFVGILGALGIALFFLLRDRGTTTEPSTHDGPLSRCRSRYC